MNCLEFRRQLGIDPHSSAAGFVRHRQDCPRCAEAATRALGFESALRRALRVEAAPQLAESILLAQATQQNRRQALLQRSGLLALAAMLAEDMQNVLRIVFALNRQWEPSWKRLPQLVAPLAVKPELLAERIEETLATHSLRQGRLLVRDTLALCPDLPRVALARERTERLLAELP